MRAVLAAIMVCCVVGVVRAEPFRTLLVTDNQVLDVEQYEAGARVEHNISGLSLGEANTNRLTDVEITSFVPFVRYGFCENVMIYGELPVRYSNSDVMDLDDVGPGDVKLGATLQADKGRESNCAIMSTAEVTLPLGDSHKLHGSGDMGFKLGLAFGIYLEPETLVILEGRYTFVLDGSGVLEYGAGIVYEVSPRLWLNLEAQGTDQELEGSMPAVAVAGMTYDGVCAVKGLSLSWSAGVGLSGASPDGLGSLNMAYRF